MSFDGQGIGNRIKGTLSLGFNGRCENPMTMKTIFLKVKYMLEFLCMSREGEAMVSEGRIPLPLHTYCGRYKEGRNETIS
jgi:hypothetical protein